MSDEPAPLFVHVNRRGSGYPSEWVEVKRPWRQPSQRRAIAYARERGFDVIEEDDGSLRVVRRPEEQASR